MSIQFKTILVPVDFSINTEVAIKKALELADTEAATIHLLHVLGQPVKRPTSAASRLANSTGMNQSYANEMLRQWKTTIEETIPTLQVFCYVNAAAPIQETVEKFANDLRCDLIVIGKRNSGSWFPYFNTMIPNKLAESTGCIVFTVKPGALHNKIKTIVVPVSDTLPAHKMEVLSAICKKARIKVHLVTFMNGNTRPDEDSASSLLQMYQWLKNSIHCPVEYAVLHGYNKPKAVLNYAEKIHADILLLHNSSETKVSWLNRHISDILPAHSRVQVLTVQPAI